VRKKRELEMNRDMATETLFDVIKLHPAQRDTTPYTSIHTHNERNVRLWTKSPRRGSHLHNIELHPSPILASLTRSTHIHTYLHT
jgi:hypothetical protein